MGTPRKFGEFARALRELARVPAQISKPVAAAITKQMRRDFAAGVDPYQRTYTPLTASSLKRGRRPPPLRKYRSYSTARPLPGGGIAMVNVHPQAGFHQTGTSRMAKRIVLPDGVVPAAWSAIIRKEFKAAVKRRVGGAR